MIMKRALLGITLRRIQEDLANNLEGDRAARLNPASMAQFADPILFINACDLKLRTRRTSFWGGIVFAQNYNLVKNLFTTSAKDHLLFDDPYLEGLGMGKEVLQAWHEMNLYRCSEWCPRDERRYTLAYYVCLQPVFFYG